MATEAQADQSPPHDGDEPTARGGAHCPLCGYDLRGLAEPRCPECGYRFAWADLTDPARRRHPFLFEHHPERSAWSFARTLLGGLRPARFWSSIHPAQRSRVGRMALYCVGCNLVFLLAYAAHAGLWIAQSRAAERASLANWAAVHYPPGSDERDAAARRHGSFDAFLQAVARDTRQSWADGGWWATRLTAACVAWPWVALLTLLALFRFSMRRARVRPVHVTRCVVYSCDATLWVGVVVALAVGVKALAWRRLLPWQWRYPGNLVPVAPVPADHVFNYQPDVVTDALFWSGCLFVILMSFRLAVAFRRYLRFDHPAATVIAAQAVAGLLLAVALVRRWLD